MIPNARGICRFLAASMLLPVIAIACITSSTVSTVPPETLGTLRGTVSFIGTPCPVDMPDRRVPPCDGPYPSYTIQIYAKDGKILIGSAVSTYDGSYMIELREGEYVIFTQQGISEDMVKENRATIVGEQTTTLDLVVDTGIR